MRSNNIFSVVLGIGVIGIFIAGVVGWVMNIISLFTSADVSLASLTLMTVLRIVGIFVPPLGAVLGWI